MITKKGLITISFILFLAAHLVLSIQQPVNGIFNIDERISVHSGLLLLLNSTPICLEWPGGPLLMSICLTALVNIAWASAFIPHMLNMELIQGAYEIGNYISSHLNAPEFYMKIRVIIHSMSLFCIPYLLFSRRIDLGEEGWLIPFGMVVSPALLTDAMIIHPDSIAVFIWSVLLIHVLFDRHHNRLTFVLLTGFLSGLLIATKLTYFIALPALIIFMTYRWHAERIGIKAISKNLIAYGGLTFSSFLAFCPFLVSQPLTMMKAFAGQLLVKSSSASDSLGPLFLDYIPNLAALPLLLLAAIGLLTGIRKYADGKQLLLIGLFLLFSLPFLKTASTYPRYAFPLLPIVLIWARNGWLYFKYSAGISLKYLTSVAILVILSGSLISATLKVVKWHQTYFSCSNLLDLQAYLLNNIEPGTTIALDEEMKYLIPSDRSSIERSIALNNSRERLLDKLNVNPKERTSVLNEEAGGFPVASVVFGDHSSQSKQLLALELDLLKDNPERVNGYDVYYYSSTPYAEITTLKSEELESIHGIRYFAAFKPNFTNGVLIKNFARKCGPPVFLFKARQ